MKHVLLISGSNRKGNTNYILEMINKNIENSELILLKERNIEFCKGCLACHNIDRCVIKDDTNEIITKMIESDLIIFGVPNYFDNVSGLFKNFMDRVHPFYKSGLIANKKVVFIYVGGGDKIQTKEELHNAVNGFVKYLKLNLVKEYSFKALDNTDIINQQEEIQKIIEDITRVTRGRAFCS